MLRLLAGPVIGALIGYCTNYIAVKMLFLPKTEIRLFGFKLPFTPGAIPKGKPRLAKAIGEVVGKTLITKEDIENRLQSEEIALQIGTGIKDALNVNVKTSLTEIGNMSEEAYQTGKEKLALMVSKEMAEALSKVELSEVIAEKGGDVVKEKVRGTMLEMFLSDELIRSVTAPIGAEIQLMIAQQGPELLMPHVLERLQVLEEQTGIEALQNMDVSEEEIQKIASGVIGSMIVPYVGKMFDSIDISEIAEQKVNEMSVDELEDLVLKVMKKELNMIVNLGAVIGLLLGTLNMIV